MSVFYFFVFHSSVQSFLLRKSSEKLLDAPLQPNMAAWQGQTSDWSVLSRQIHSDVSGLSLEMKALMDA